MNGAQHELALRVFMVIVLAHWAEHLLQAFQIYALGWPVPEARGLLGLSLSLADQVGECCTTATRVVMLAGLWLLRPGFTGTTDRRWWTIALGIQFFHHFEHLLLSVQALLGHNLFGRPVPTSLIQLWVPRVELHLFYNTIVFIPMVIGDVLPHVPAAGRSPQPAVHLRVGPWPRRRGLKLSDRRPVRTSCAGRWSAASCAGATRAPRLQFVLLGRARLF